jgi:hypothetical protein
MLNIVIAMGVALIEALAPAGAFLMNKLYDKLL